MNDMTPTTFASESAKVIEKPAVPQWSPKWWYDLKKLDGRPIIWSLKNRPDDWSIDSGNCVLTHKPSDHQFWVYMGQFYLWHTPGCGCQRGTDTYFQRGQHFRLRWALRRWKMHTKYNIQQRKKDQKIKDAAHQQFLKTHKHFQEHFTLGHQ